jgi:hypothetical protein
LEGASHPGAPPGAPRSNCGADGHRSAGTRTNHFGCPGGCGAFDTPSGRLEWRQPWKSRTPKVSWHLRQARESRSAKTFRDRCTRASGLAESMTLHATEPRPRRIDLATRENDLELAGTALPRDRSTSAGARAPDRYRHSCRYRVRTATAAGLPRRDSQSRVVLTHPLGILWMSLCSSRGDLRQHHRRRGPRARFHRMFHHAIVARLARTASCSVLARRGPVSRERDWGSRSNTASAP